LKNTEELMNELKNSESIEAYLATNSDEMLEISLSDYLRELMNMYELDKSSIFKKANMSDTNYGYEIFRGENKKASRDKLIQICFGYPLTCEEAQKVLRLGKTRPLYPRDKRDAIILFALKNKLTIAELNNKLFDAKEKLLSEKEA